MSDSIIKKLTSRGLVKVSDHPEGHRTDVAVIWQVQRQKQRLSESVTEVMLHRRTYDANKASRIVCQWSESSVNWAKIYVGGILGCKKMIHEKTWKSSYSLSHVLQKPSNFCHFQTLNQTFNISFFMQLQQITQNELPCSPKDGRNNVRT